MKYNGTDEALAALADELGTMVRNLELGYQGGLTLKKVRVIPVFTGDDGEEYVMDAAAAESKSPTLAARQWTRVPPALIEGVNGGEGNPISKPFDFLRSLAGGPAGGFIGRLVITWLEKLIKR